MLADCILGERLQAMVLEGTSTWFDNVNTDKVKERETISFIKPA